MGKKKQQQQAPQPIVVTTKTELQDSNSLNHNTNKHSNKQKVSLLRFYEELTLAAKMQHSNRSSFCTKSDDSVNGIAVDFMSTVSGDYITYYYYINKLPRRVPLNFKTQMRQVCDKNTRITFFNSMEPHKMNMTSSKMKSKLRVLSQIGKENEDKEVNAYNMHENIEEIQHQDWVEDSLMYFSDASITRGCGMFRTTMMVQITGKRGLLFDNSVKQVIECAERMGISMVRIMYDLPDVLRSTSPFTHAMLPEVQKNMPISVMTDEIAARFNSYAQGVTGKQGIYFGSDIHTGSPVFKPVKKSPDDPEIWLITAQTGGGKSFYTKFILLELLAMGCNCTILDVEGDEYIPMARALSYGSRVSIVNLGEGTGRYFDPVAIAPPLNIPDIDAESKKMSINYTTSTLKVLLGKTYDTSTWYDTVVADVVAYTYKNAGVTEDPKTWGKSQNLTLHDVYANLGKLIGSQGNEDYDKAVKNAITYLKKYFAPDGIHAGLFKNRISIGEVANADLVICSFGMKGRDPSTVDETQMNLMQLGAAQFSHQRSIFSKAKKKYNVKVWEEVQRWGSFKGSVGVLKTAITGGRKLGDISIVVTNDIGSLLVDDKFALINNSTAKFIGKLVDVKVLHDLCEALAITDLEDELMHISKSEKKKAAGGSESVQSPYTNAFLCCLDNGSYAVSKMLLPKKLATSKIFSTGVH